jgi:anti-sigma-K factor RskA
MLSAFQMFPQADPSTDIPPEILPPPEPPSAVTVEIAPPIAAPPAPDAEPEPIVQQDVTPLAVAVPEIQVTSPQDESPDSQIEPAEAIVFGIAEPRPARTGTLSTTRLWQVATALACVAALTFGALAFAPRAATPTALSAIGVVNAPAPLYLAEIDSKLTLRITPLATIAVPNGRDLQLWVIPPGEQTPASLGILAPRGLSVTLPKMPPEGTRFVVSLEPRGGATGDRITGQVLYGGTLANR